MMSYARLRNDFLRKYAGKVFTKEDMREFLQEHLPAMINVSRLIDREENRILGIFIRGMLDDERFRDAYALNIGEDAEDCTQVGYALVSKTENLEVLSRQDAKLLKLQEGVEASRLRIVARRTRLMQQAAESRTEIREEVAQ